MPDPTPAPAPCPQPIPRPIPGTTLFDGGAARRGYPLNAMCFSFNSAANRAAFAADEDAYCGRFALTPDQRRAVAERDVPGMIAAGGNIYYLAKLAGILGLGVQDVGALQTGMTVEAFRAMLLAQGRGQSYAQSRAEARHG